MRRTKIVAAIAAAIIIGGLGLYLFASHSGAAKTRSAQKLDLRSLNMFMGNRELRYTVRDVPECAEERAAAQFYKECFALFQAGPEADCATLADRPAKVTLPKDFEEAYYRNTLYYRNVPKNCQSDHFGMFGSKYQIGKDETDDQ